MRGAIAIIPARLGSERFPGKVLADATGEPLIWHVYQAASRAQAIARAVVAADSPRVVDAVTSRGGEAILTGEHANGTSRLAEAAGLLGLSPETIVVNVQGDEPEMEPATIDAVVRTLSESGAQMATAACAFAPGEDADDPNIVKIVRTLAGHALYFSRSRIPHERGRKGPPLRHIGIYAYTRRFLDVYAAYAPTPLESAESLEQLRALEQGHAIAVALVDGHAPGIDTPEQYAAFVARTCH